MTSKLTLTAMGSTADKRNDFWGTPVPVFDWLDEVYEFDLDAFADETNHKCPRYFTKEQNALAQVWAGSVFMNPPYSIVSDCMEYAWEQRLNCKNIVALVPASTETQWYHRAFWRVMGKAQPSLGHVIDHRGKAWVVLAGEFGEVWLSPYRIQFIDPTDGKRARNPKGSTIFVFYGHQEDNQ